MKILKADEIANDAVASTEIADGAVFNPALITVGHINVKDLTCRPIDCRGLGIDPDTGQFVAGGGSVTLDENGLTLRSPGPDAGAGRNWLDERAGIRPTYSHCEYCGNRLLEEDRKCPFCSAPRKD